MKGTKLVLMLMLVLLLLALVAPMAFAGSPPSKVSGGSTSGSSSDWLVDKSDGDVLRCVEKSCRGTK